jgi:NAD dependent epimerase/dehydratase family enzyme
MKSEPSLALTSQCCAPIHFLEAGFEYNFSKLRPALEDLCYG